MKPIKRGAVFFLTLWVHFVSLADTTVISWGDLSYQGSGAPSMFRDATNIAAGYYHSYAIGENGSLAVWGLYPASGGIGWFPCPPPPASASNVVAVAAGAYYFTLALRSDGSVVAWAPPGYPAAPPTSSWTNIVSITAYENSALVARANGIVAAYRYASPPGSLTNVVAVSLGSVSALALRRDGTVVAWGGTTNVPPGLFNIVAIDSGGHHSALRADGTVIVWNANETFVLPGITNAVAIDTGVWHTLALLADGSVVGAEWPAVSGTTYKPHVVPTGLRNVIAISSHHSKSMALVRLPLPLLEGLPGMRISHDTLVYSSAGPHQIVSPNEVALSSQQLQGMYGWTFRLKEQASLTGLGWLDDSANGLSQPHQVGLWRDEPGLPSLPYVAGSNLVLVASVMISAGTNTSLDGAFRRIDFATNVTLMAGSYVISGTYDGAVGEIVRYVQEAPGSSALSNALDPRIELGSPAVAVGPFQPPVTFMPIPAAELGPMVFFRPQTNLPPPPVGQFANLDFEMADLPIPPAEFQYSGYPATLALPRWEINLPSVLYNMISLDDMTVCIQHSNALSGNFSACVQFTPYGKGEFWQRAMVPASARSLRFITSVLRREETELQVFAGGEQLALSPIETGDNSMQWVADVSRFAGSVTELRFTARSLFDSVPGLPTSAKYGTVGFDEIQFSAVPVTTLIADVSGPQYAFRGGDAALGVKTQGPGPFTYTWHHGSELIPAAAADDLVLTNVDYSDAGQYTVTVSNPSGSLSSKTRLQVGQIAYWGGVRGYDDAYYPVDPPPVLTNVISVAAGRDFGMAITGDGIPHMWLYRNELRFPFWVTGVIGSSAGSYAGLILRDTGDVYLRNEHSWALPDKGANTQDIVAISGGATHYLALTTRGTVRAWRDDSFHPGDIPADLERVVAVAAGEGHSLALQDDGTVVAWGDNTMGQTNIPSGLSNVVGITAGGNFSVALTEGGKVVSWGAAPPPPPGLEGVIRIAAGRAHVLALRADGTVLSWGSQTNVPPGLHNVLAISTREDFNLALVGDGPPPAGVALEDPIMTPQGVSVSFPTTSGRVYRLEYRDTWSDAWHPLPLIAGNSRQRTATDPSPTSQTRFYRVRQW